MRPGKLRLLLSDPWGSEAFPGGYPWRPKDHDWLRGLSLTCGYGPVRVSVLRSSNSSRPGAVDHAHRCAIAIYHGVDKRSTTSLRERTREHSSQRSFAGWMLSS